MLTRIAATLCLVSTAAAVEVVTLTPQTWDEFAPSGKEVDCIYGDTVLRNELITCVVARQVPSRNANMTVRGVGGMLIDLTRRDRPSDQLSAYYPGGGKAPFHSDKINIVVDGKSMNRPVASGKQITLELTGGDVVAGVLVQLKYTLSDGLPFIAIETIYHNHTDKAIEVELRDMLRADRTFKFGEDKETHLVWAYDQWFRQAYGIVASDYNITRSGSRSIAIRYFKDGQAKTSIAAGDTYTLSRKVFPAEDLLNARAVANQIANKPSKKIAVRVTDPAGDVGNALITVLKGERLYATGRTRSDGTLDFELPLGGYDLKTTALGRPADFTYIDTEDRFAANVRLKACGYVAAKVTDDKDTPIPCKVEFIGINGTDSPFYGPDSAAFAVQNLVYTHDGKFRQEIGPGQYEVVISHGPEYDAVFQSISVKRGEETKVTAKLKRVIDTDGWISSDFHSHSSPSGDNTGSQFGRVLNLLAEHIEFAPCTEHNRIDSYVPHLKRLNCEHLLATCTGMELTGSPLPINHQNVFPLIHKPRAQDGGAPLTDLNPVVQIERLAMWDSKSDKLVQENHPHIHQILGDRDLDGKPDEGFSKMLGFMDVIEIHPPRAILYTPEDKDYKSPRYNKMMPWMQLLNLGYRIPGVVNTDAHYNFHGSGWLRNYIKCDTDNPAEIQTMDIVHASKRGNLVMTNGPFLTVGAEARTTTNNKGDREQAIPGQDLHAPNGKVRMHIKVQCPNWIDINRVQLFLNGRKSDKFNFMRRITPKHFSDNVVKFDAKFDLQVEKDTHIIVAAAGEGLQLGKVMGPTWGKEMPIAVSNPIFVDLKGDGFDPNEDALDYPLPLK